MATKNKSRYSTKENRIPLGKKKENFDKLKLSNNDELELFDHQLLPKKKALKTNKKPSKYNQSKILKIVNINEAPTDTSLTQPIEKQRPKLSTIKEKKELEENVLLSNIKTKLNIVQSKTKDNSMSIEKNEELEKTTVLAENIQETNVVDNFNNTINDMNPNLQVPDIVLSPFVCTTRGQKWRPSPRKPPKLSERFSKYEDDNIADTYRKKLDGKTMDLQNKVKHWTELSSENGSNIPLSIKDEIDVVCGQTKLLTTDKFMQMRTLIEEFDNKSGSMPITTTDLDGFWDMLLLQVEKLEGQFSQLAILEENNWIPLQPIAKKVINKIPKVIKRPDVKSKFTDFLKNQKAKEKKITTDCKHLNRNQDSKHFNEMKLPNNTCLISSTPTSSNRKSSNLSPMLLKTIELSYVARRSGMTPLVLAKPHLSPLKPALKNPELGKGMKRKNIHFETHKTSSDKLVTPTNSFNDDLSHKKSSIQNRIATPHTVKTLKINRNDISIESQNIGPCPSTKSTINNVEVKSNVKTKTTKEKNTINNEQNVKFKNTGVIKAKKQSVSTDNCATNAQVCTTSEMRRSSRLANKPSKNYKC